MLRPQQKSALGWWTGDKSQLHSAGSHRCSQLFESVQKPVLAVSQGPTSNLLGFADHGAINAAPADEALPLVGWVGALPPQYLGDSQFCQDFGIAYPYLTGSMANGIASQALVISMADHGMLGFFGSAGLAPQAVKEAIAGLHSQLGDRPFGLNLIHSPNDPALEEAVAELFVNQRVRFVEASAYLTLTLPLLRCRYAGISLLPDGTIDQPTKLVAKVSRLEVASKFFAPPPAAMLAALVERGQLTSQQAELASRLPVASAVTAEADSGGHTDNRPAISLVPSVIELRDTMAEQNGVFVPVGAAGGISTPASAAAAFAMGAAYIMTGSVNQACLESGSCDYVRQLLAKAGPADVTMAPAADMFEMGVNVQVLKWGTMFAAKARRLYDWYRRYDSFAQIPAAEQALIEKDYLRSSFEQAWQSTEAFFAKRDPRQIAKAQQSAKHKMALVFRSYLGQASRWANVGEPSRRNDYQIWCGPSMGAFNQWAKGSFLDSVEQRQAHVIALNLLVGASCITRVNCLRHQGLVLPNQLAHFRPHTLPELEQLLQEN